MRRQRLRTLIFLAIGLGAAAVALVSYGFGFLDRYERDSIDARFSIRGTQDPPRDIVLVKVDDNTFSRLPNVQWPYPRSLHAKVIDRLGAAGAKVIAFDIQFSELSAPAQDNALYLAIRRNRGKVVLATTEVTDSGEPNLIFSPSDLKAIGAHAGNANFKSDSGDVIRRMSYKVDGLKSLAVVAAETARGRSIAPRGADWIDFAGAPGTVNSVSYVDVLKGKVAPAVFRGKIVVVGATAPSLQDVHATPTSPAMSGPEVQANAIETALRGFPLRSASSVVNVLLILLLAFMVPLVSLRVSPIIAGALAALAAGAFSAGTQMSFERGWIVSFVYPLSGLALATVGALGAHYTVAAFERERVRDLFSRFVPEQVVDQVLARTDRDLRLGGSKVMATVMFSDLRGFTSSAEHMPAEDVIDMLNEYLGEMSDAILDHGGTLVSYAGDGIMAVFGAPIDQPDHPDRALATAREMLEVRLPRFNRWLREHGLGEGYRMGVGLNTGPIMSGNVGHERRLEYTAIGDTVNTASRIEGLTKGTPFSLFVSETTFSLLSTLPPDLVFFEEVEIRGREQRLKLWGFEPQPEAVAVSEPEPAPEPEPEIVEAPPQVEPV